MDTEKRSYQGEIDSESFSSEQDGLVSGSSRVPGRRTRPRMMTCWIVPALILCSISLNIFQVVYIAVRRPKCHSLYAKLPENEITIPFHYATEYSSDEYTGEDKDALWNSIDISEGFVALTHEESDALGLPRSQTFPWDVNKGIKKPLVAYHHIEHCLDLLRQDIICHADDFMDFTGGHGDEFLTGDNQPRKCRDWNKLSDWVKERSACYKTVNITRAGEDHGVTHQLDRYTHCPKGSPYEPLIEAWKDLGRFNPGNLPKESVDSLTETQRKKDAEELAAHNHDILDSD
ncbi:uncharacterized protein GIQ15_03715 [Arthroderma uncinatum]|uniref:uncharacterized protein n=1 Tax=Arthroderma uncinatum TaxID=74035 RepID=UPI00144AC257|nr:uncharacterized protein GIQ15_03715 [Arthroderma uncinatum]KAF3484391.1 hypothetical protein GIQ15_03715 [Arthroderma uncinatum]